jgi:16S rRNA (adenine1518-N6/adenine1519-N6)-dimethyltransferase
VVKARRRFAQHFLEPAWVTKLVGALALTARDRVVEIGPGRGALTRKIAASVDRVLAIEVDRDLAGQLIAERLPGLTILVTDVLDVNLAAAVSQWLGGPCSPASAVRVVGNLPYNLSTPILFKLLAFAAETGGVSDATLMLQREVADRLVARPGGKDYGVLTILTAVQADVSRILALPPGAFRPAPQVSSAVVRLRFRPPPVPIADRDLFTRMVRSMFTMRRKTLANALRAFAEGSGTASTTALREADLDARRRPETLQLVELARLADVFASYARQAVL